MVAITSLMSSMGMSPTTLGLLISSRGRGSEALRLSPAATKKKNIQKWQRGGRKEFRVTRLNTVPGHGSRTVDVFLAGLTPPPERSADDGGLMV